MNIAELFINLGITGSDKTVGALGDVKKGLGGVASMSLEAKAGILAAMYGLERMMAQSGQAGTGLTNFAALTGLSTKNLQQWQYAARQAGVSNEEFTGSLKGVQSSMTNMLLGKGAPEGMALLVNATKMKTDTAHLRDSFYVMSQLQKAAQTLPKDVGNNMLKSFGLSEGTISAMRRNSFNSKTMGQAPTYSEKEIGQLDKANIGWSNLGNKIEMAFGHFNAKHGAGLIKDISKVADSVFKLVEAFEKLAEYLHVFEHISDVFKGWALILDGLSGGHVMEGIGDAAKGLGLTILDSFKDAPHPVSAGLKGQVGVGSGHTTTINQTITHHGDAKDTQKVKASHKTAVSAAYRQRPNYVGN